MKNIWEKVLTELRGNVSSDIYATWFKKIAYHQSPEEAEGKLTLTVPSQPHLQYLRKNWADRLQSLASQVAGQPITIKFLVAQTVDPIIPTEIELPLFDSPNEEAKPEISIDQLAEQCGLHRGLTFETFVTGKANEVARSSAEIVSSQPGTQFNPFFIYGGVGLGKTHLMHAIGRRILENNPKAKIRCVSADVFVREVVDLSSGGTFSDAKIKKFDETYRTLDVLLMDDVQLLAKKGGTQNHLFGIFESLLPNNKQIIMTCDTYARQLSDFDDRLISRLTKGLSVGIEPAEFELRAAILFEKAKQQGLELPEDVAYYIARRMNTNIRELEGALNTVIMNAKVYNAPITVELATRALRGMTSTGPISLENIQKETAQHFNIKIADMYSSSRKASIVKPRMIAMYLAKELTQKSLMDIGSSFGGRDHTTVLNAVRKISKERAADPELNHTLHLIEQSLKNWA